MQPGFCEMISAMTHLKDPIAPGAQGRIGDARNTINHMRASECRRVVAMLSDLIRAVEISAGEQQTALGQDISIHQSGAA